MQDSHSRYPYDKLRAPHDIRVLTLHKGHEGEPLFGTIRHVNLDDKPEYSCLSYRWGQVSSSYTIKCNEGNFEIPTGPNLWNALCNLRYQNTDRTLWVDQICINQEDNQEKSTQVMLMGKIFQSAVSVVAWLGLVDDDTPLALDFIKDVAKIAEDEWRAKREFQQTADNRELIEVIVKKYPASRPEWTAARSLFRRDWFPRMWVFQEVVLPERLFFRIGEFVIRGNLMFIFGSLSMERPKEDVLPLGDEIVFLQQICRARTMHQNLHGNDWLALLNIIELLNDLRARKATDHRDMIYALLDVARDDCAKFIKPDYSCTWQEVYIKCTRQLVEASKNLDVLKLTEIKGGVNPDLPSWVPDLRTYDSMNFLYHPRVLVRNSDNKLYIAAGSAKAEIGTTNDSKLLSLKGILIGTITSMTQPAGNLTGNVTIGARVLDGGEWPVFAASHAINGLYQHTGEPIALAYNRLRRADNPHGTEARRKFGQTAPQDISSSSTYSFSNAGDQRLHGDRDGHGMAILSQTTRRRMYITDTGYMGLAHRSILVGDKVFVVLGNDMPYVLRPKGPHYIFKGETYVHGIMDGEALTSARQKSDPTWICPGKMWVEDLNNDSLPFETEELILE